MPDPDTAFQGPGRTRPQKLASREDHREALLRLIARSRRAIDLVSRHLDPLIFDEQGMVDTFTNLALRNRKARIRILILDPAPLRQRDHRLVALAQRLSGSFELRTPAPEHRNYNESVLIADGESYLHSPLSDRYEGEVYFHAPDGAVEWLRRFEDLWQTALPDPNLRRLFL